MRISLLQDKRICSEINGKIIFSDQSEKSNGLGVYPSPFDLFKASLGCCMGYYVTSFCMRNNIPLDSVFLDIEFAEEEMINAVSIKFVVDERFPQKYSNAIIKAAESCKVKKQLKSPIEFNYLVQHLENDPMNS